MSPHERRERLHELGRRFDARSVPEQTSLKQRLLQRDLARGIDPVGRREAWWEAHSPEERQRRVEARLERWNTLPTLNRSLMRERGRRTAVRRRLLLRRVE